MTWETLHPAKQIRVARWLKDEAAAMIREPEPDDGDMPRWLLLLGRHVQGEVCKVHGKRRDKVRA